MKSKIILVVLLLISFCININLFFFSNTKVETYKYSEGSLEDFQLYNNIPKDGIISNATLAVNYAEILISEIFGDSEKYRPYNVIFDKIEKVWIIEGTLKKNKNPYTVTFGGVPYVIIQKEDGKIRSIWHTQ